MPENNNTVSGTIGNLFNTGVTLVTKTFNKAFQYTDFYSANYSKYLVYGGLIYLLGKMMKVKVNVGK